MKKIKLNVKHLAGILGGFILLASPAMFVSCSEEIDESNFAIKSEMTAADFIESDPNYSMAKQIFLNVRLGNTENSSPIYSALTARGNYTVFLPTNEAIKLFYESKHLTSFEELLQSDELSSLVAKSCIIDHDEDNAYETVDFPTSGTFGKPNLNDRLLTCKEDTLSRFIINGTSMIIDQDNEVSNGFIHVVDHVVAPSALTLPKLIDKATNLRFFSHLLKVTKWDESLTEHLDAEYEDPDRLLTYTLTNVKEFKNAMHRYLGYTAFVETDDVYAKSLNLAVKVDAETGEVTNSEELLAALEKKVAPIYGNAEVGNYTSPDNAVNRFVAYHLLKGRMAYNKMVHHYNEYNYDYVDPKHPKIDNNKMPTNVWDYFVSMGKYPSLLKITQVGDASVAPNTDAKAHPIYVNRVSEYANGPEQDYHETGFSYEGYLVHEHNVDATTGEVFDNNGLNGFYFCLDDLLVYEREFTENLERTRIRFDVSTVLHELLSNDIRGGEYTHFENGYFENISRESSDTKLLYLQSFSSAMWKDYQGDEFMVSGLYDFTMKLPPVPTKGTYEIRMGVSHNSLRGMCQIYFGTDPDRLMPAGLPYDMRQNTNDNPAIPWVKDGEEEDDRDWEVIRENDKKLRNQGYMKGPQYFLECKAAFNERKPVRDIGGNSALRRIITVADMDPNETYYLRFKTALKKLDSQFFMDYFEYAHKQVYNGPTAEDIW